MLNYLMPFMPEYSRPYRIILIAAAVAVFAGVFLHHAHPIKLGDFWGHLASGRWIVENASLPDSDPFTFTAPPETDARHMLVLRGYWLWQASLYAIYLLFGFGGIIASNAMLFVLISFLVFRLSVRLGSGEGIGLLSAILVSFTAFRFDEVRPHGFSFALFLILILIMDSGIKALKDDKKRGLFQPPFACLPLAMILWANIHRGFPIGYAVIGAFAGWEVLLFIIKSDKALERDKTLFIIKWSLLGVFASFMNPNHLLPVYGIFAEALIWNRFGDIIELLPPWEHANYLGDPSALRWHLGILGASAILIFIDIVSRRKTGPALLILYVLTMVLSLMTTRMTMFFIPLSLSMAGGLAGDMLGERRRIASILGTLAAAFLGIWLAFSCHAEAFYKKGPYYSFMLPEKAADFIEAGVPAGKIFAPFEWGGYLEWRLYPGRLMFVDSRFYDEAAHKAYEGAKYWQDPSALDSRRVEAVLFYPVYFIDLAPQPLVIGLLKHPNWRPVYFDGRAVVFLRRGLNESLPEVGKAGIWKAVEEAALKRISRSPKDPELFRELAGIYFAMGDFDRASLAIAKAEELKEGR